MLLAFKIIHALGKTKHVFVTCMFSFPKTLYIFSLAVTSKLTTKCTVNQIYLHDIDTKFNIYIYGV